MNPYGNRILGEIANVKEITEQGLILGEDRAPQSVRIRVIAVGPEVKHTKVADIVLVSAFAPTEARLSKLDKTVIFSEDDVLCGIPNK